MQQQEHKPLTLLGVPMDLGADRRGVDMGPSAIRCAGVEQRLQELGYTVYDEGDVAVRRAKQYEKVPKSNLKYLYEIVRVNVELRDHVQRLCGKGHFPLVLGGDHSIAIGTLAGIGAEGGAKGVIWYDSHGDMNTAETSPSGNIHGMALAAAMGYGHPLLTGVGGEQSRVKPEHTVLIGARSLDAGERKLLRELGVTVFTMHEIDRYGISRIMEQTLDIVTKGTDGVHLSLDLDGVDPKDAPGVGTPVPSGITLRESLLAMELLADAGVVTSAEFVEVNPTLDVRNQTAKAAVELIAALLGEKIF